MPEKDNIAQQFQDQSHAAFRYKVDAGDGMVAAFTECTLPTIEWEVEEVKEGGLNTHVHILPTRRKAARLTLKHGIGKGKLLSWYLKTLDEEFIPREISIQLLDAKENTVATWVMHDAFPIKWTGPQLKSDSSSVAIQSIEFACGDVRVEI